MASRLDEPGQRSSEVVLALRTESARRIQASRARRARLSAAVSLTALSLLAGEGAALRWFAGHRAEPQVVAPPPGPGCVPPDTRDVDRRLQQVEHELFAMPWRPIDAEPRHRPEGPLPKTDVARGMNDLRGRLARCSLDNRGPRVVVVLNLTIGISGRVKAVSVDGRQVGSAWRACLRAAASTALFPQADEETGAAFPFLLAPPLAIAATSEECAVSPTKPPRAPTMADVEAKLETACSGPEGLEDCAPTTFDKTFEAELYAIDHNARELEDLWLHQLRTGDSRAAYGLAWLGVERALPDLRRRLLAERDVYGWHGPPFGERAPLPSDGQLPHQGALIMAIETLSGCSARRAVKLTRAERRSLEREAAEPPSRHTPSQSPAVARWLLDKLDWDPPARRPPKVDDDCWVHSDPFHFLR